MEEIQTRHNKVIPAQHGPTISVIIPVFNRADCIVQAIASCLAQDDINLLEVLVVDDASTDCTREAVRSIDDPRLRLIRRERNGGGAACRNTGIDNANGDYVAFLDSDDTWDRHKLAEQIRTLGEHGWNPAIVCHSQYRAITPSGVSILPDTAKPVDVGVAEYLFVQRGHIQTSSLLLPTELARRTRFDPDLRKHQDYDFCLRLEQHGARFLMVDQPLLSWFHDNRPDRITHRYGLDASEYFLESRLSLLGRKAADAFWTRHIFPKKFRVTPVAAMTALSKRMFSGPLPMRWYGQWLWTGVKHAVRRLLGSGRSA